MGSVKRAWRKALQVTWTNLIMLIGVNLLWVLGSVLVVTVGPSTFAAYHTIATVAREEQGKAGIRPFFAAFRRFFFRGLVWSLCWAVLLWLVYAGLMVWPRLLPPFGAVVVQIAYIYVLTFLLAMQPYLLEGLIVEEFSWKEALRRAAWHVLANPLYSHAQLIIPLVVLLLGLKFTTAAPLVLVSVVLSFAAVAAVEAPLKYGQVRPLGGREEDVL